MKNPISIVVLIVPIIIIGCGSGPGPDSISSHRATGTSTSLDCLVCHSSQSAYDPVLTNGSGAAGKHVVHVQDAQIPCTKCHFGYTDYSTHMNGIWDTSNPSVRLVHFDSENASGEWNDDTGPQTGTCANTYCHSSATGGTQNTGGITRSSFLNSINDPKPVTTNASLEWYTTGSLSCISCHGCCSPWYKDGRPIDYGHTQTHNGSPCNYCHYATTHDGKTIFDSSKHANGIYDVVPDPTYVDSLGNHISFTYQYDAGGGKCSNVSCHSGFPGYWNSSTMGSTGISANFNFAGAGCNDINATATPLGGLSTPYPPYTYDWDWGDGTHTTGTAETGPVTAYHKYPQTGTYYLMFSYRDKYYLTGDLMYSRPVSVSIASNKVPVVSATASVQGYTVTITDQSYDTDAYFCGHSGLGTIQIDWRDGTTTTQPINLTDQPSNTTYSHTYAPTTYPLVSQYWPLVKVTDNSSASVQNNIVGWYVNVPTSFTITGKITHTGGTNSSGTHTPGQPYSNAVILIKTKTGVSVTNTITYADGSYTTPAIPDTQHYDLIPVPYYTYETFTFTSASVDIYQDATVNITATP